MVSARRFGIRNPVGRLVAVALLVCAFAAGAAEPDAWYVATVSSSEGGALVTHHWSKGRMFRAESVLSGHRVVSIVNGRYYYTLDPVKGAGVRIERGPKALEDDVAGGRPFAREWHKLSGAGAEKIRSESLFGQQVDVYQLTDQIGRKRVWFSASEPHLPFRVEVFDRRNSSTSVVDYSGWNRGLQIADSFFEPHPGISLEEVSYEEYRERSKTGPVGPVPVLYRELLHGERGQ